MCKCSWCPKTQETPVTYSRLLALPLLLLALSCTDERHALPTGPSKPTAVVTGPQLDTTHASSICRASVRAGEVARLRLAAAPRDTVALQRTKAFDALVGNACR
jgi:hypothetical protein